MTTPAIPEWLQTEAPGALKIWDDVTRRLEKLGRLGDADPECLAAYSYCMEKAAYFKTTDPSLIKWNGSLPPADQTYHEERWRREARQSSGNPLSGLWRRAAEYCAVHLGLIKPRHISFIELLLEDGWDELDHEGHLIYMHGGEVMAHLDRHWQFGED